jgi:hypothetical protein
VDNFAAASKRWQTGAAETDFRVSCHLLDLPGLELEIG